MVHPMLLPRFEFEAPPDLAVACARLAEVGDEGCVLAGGTDLLVKLKHRQLRPRLVVSLGRVAGLDQLEATADGGIRIGPMCTMSQLAHSQTLGAAAWTGVAEGAAAVAGPLIRNRATVGGNLANARPCADTAPPLMTLGARLTLAGAEATRSVDLADFITGPGQTTIRPGEIVAAVELPPPTGPAGSAYLKLTRRAAMEVTIVGCAASVVLDRGRRRIERARLALTSVAPVPLLVPQVEAVLGGEPIGPGAVAEAARAARAAACPIDDHRAPGEYRDEVVEVLARRALTLALERAGGPVLSGRSGAGGPVLSGRSGAGGPVLSGRSGAGGPVLSGRAGAGGAL